MDYDAIDQKMSEGVRMFVLCNPQNPTGRVWEKAELERLAELCKKHDVIVFSDDIHADIIMPGSHYQPFIGISEDAAMRTVCAMAPSKTFNIAGLKSSFVISKNPELLNKVQKEAEAFDVGVDLFGYAATEMAYACGDRYVDELCAYLYENEKLTVQFMDEQLPDLKAYVPEGTYLMWVDCRGLGLSMEALMKKLCDAGVQPNDGARYGAEGDGFIRLNIGTQRSRLLEALDRMKTALSK